MLSLVNVVETSMSTMMMAFFSTRSIANASSGTYMTFLTTLTNLGNFYPITLTLYLINLFTVKVCFPSTTGSPINSTINYTINNYNYNSNTCSSKALSSVSYLFFFRNKTSAPFESRAGSYNRLLPKIFHYF